MQFTIRDEGRGIARETIPRIFERFWRAHGGEGVGLGLYIAKGIIEQHGGRLWVESQLGVGSTFHTLIPTRTARPKRLTNGEVAEALPDGDLYWQS